MSLTQSQVTEYRQLKDSGVDVTKRNHIRFNEGSETAPHITVKSLVGLLAIRNGYRVDSEVPVSNTRTTDGEIDVLIWGHDSRLSYAVEIETSPAPDVKAAKLDKYVRHTAVDDMQMLNLNQCSQEITDAFGWVATELGLPA